MSVRIVRLGDLRLPEEGVRIGIVRRPPRGVRKERYAADDWFDVWYPDLAPGNELMSQGKAASTDGEWAAFVKAFRTEMSKPMHGARSIFSPRSRIAAASRSAATVRANPAATARCFANF